MPVQRNVKLAQGGISVTRHRELLTEAMRRLSERSLLVGISSQKTGREDDAGAHVPITNAEIGFVMEKGSPEQHIPARPWLRPGVADARKRITSYFVQAGYAALLGDVVKVDTCMNAAGLVAVSSVQHKLRVGPFQPLAESTVRARIDRRKSASYRARRHAQVDANIAAGLPPQDGIYKPLIDTAQLLRSVTYVIRFNDALS